MISVDWILNTVLMTDTHSQQIFLDLQILWTLTLVWLIILGGDQAGTFTLLSLIISCFYSFLSRL